MIRPECRGPIVLHLLLARGCRLLGLELMRGASDQITLVGIAATLLVSVANLIYSLRNNKRTIFVNTVTTSRLKWIDSLRDKVSEFIAVTACLSDHSSQPEKTAELMLQRDTLLHQISLHLNPLDSEDQEINMLANRARELSEGGDAKELPVVLSELCNATGNYLKKEWNRVKKESAGKLS